MEIPGGLFVNSNYTLFMVVANPTKMNVSGDNVVTLTTKLLMQDLFFKDQILYHSEN
jgi:hypothetical protein